MPSEKSKKQDTERILSFLQAENAYFAASAAGASAAGASEAAASAAGASVAAAS
ncbi:hypothetical protein F528_1736, partial [Neisseria meningitidis 992008]